jgi:glycosyltransferase involved in cell wall biosynthesis
MKEQPRMSASIMVSVVVPVRNGGALLERALHSLLRQEYPRDRYEVLVVDNGSTDGSAATAQRLGVSPLSEPRPGPQFARNRGIAQAKGDVVAFTDADCEVPRDWIGGLVEALRDREAVMARIVADSEGNRYARARAHLHGLFLDDCSRRHRINRLDRLDTGNAAVWRRVLDEVGGFDPEFFACEDSDLGARIAERGGRIAFAETPVVRHGYEGRIATSLRKAKTVGRMWARLPQLRPAATVDRHYADVKKLYEAAAYFACRPRELRMRFWAHLAATVLHPGFAGCLHHFREAERLSMLGGILSGLDERSEVLAG